MKLEHGGVTSPRGFRTGGIRAGVKRQGPDVALVYSEVPANIAAVFTTNMVKAAPVLWSQRLVEGRKTFRGVVVNSGNANACTGPTGLDHAIAMGEAAARALDVGSDEVLVASTGVIGVPLPIDLICDAIAQLGPSISSSPASADEAALAITTTDTFTKQAAVQVEIGGYMVTVGGMAKGSGMIHPNMATMLAFITTDANVSPAMFDRMLRESAADSYNMISVDGDTSTNDSLFAFANGLAENPEITDTGLHYNQLKEALHQVNTDLARQIIRDGEGATKLIEVRVQGAQTKEQASVLAKSVLTSNLVKTAFFGEDPNWGRILAAMGYAGVAFDPARVDVDFHSKAGSIRLMEDSEPLPFDEITARQILHEPEIEVRITLHEGSAEAVGWGCDLSYEYVKINGEYRT